MKKTGSKREWLLIPESVERRERIGKMQPHCPECDTQQVQIFNWYTDNVQMKCRHCKHKFIIVDKGA
ncbi:MAG: hypothetical protein ACRC6V_09460 [Bacteroidales bacterium]